ncbi:ubiquinol-cytochrome C chaperone family protein [Telmatospirillum sp. J64-1]|uniref:ubiquinol-cytochrome C chaperone family protein n=1 Tax=Telmatospirillum sp. J64-1 TaxID=2502183 RepID=UPI00115E8EC6|nr:ubiquinol-cytochrome C chaperone family protein [Telmatospirillum sp. J64-1]
MPFFRLFKRPRFENEAHDLYASLVGQSRLPIFYTEYGVEDTVDGRFDLLAIHAFLVMRRLKIAAAAGTPDAADLSQALFDLMFADMDVNLREMGVGDMGVSTRVKKMAQAFYGRVAAYEAGLESEITEEDGDSLQKALRRNLYRKMDVTDDAVAAMAAYMRRQDKFLAGQTAEDLMAGRVTFTAPEAVEGGGNQA